MISTSTLYSIIGAFVSGLLLPIRAAGLIFSKPKLLFWSSLPITITIGLYWILISKTHAFLSSLLHPFFVQFEGRFPSYLETGTSWLIHFFILHLSALTFSFVASLVSCPLNDFLAEQAEKYILPLEKQAPNSKFKQRIWLISMDILRSFFSVILNLLALALSLFPGMSLITVPLTFFLISFQFLSYPQIRRHQGITQSLEFLRLQLPICMGFGACIAFLFSIPIISLFTLPLAVVGGTLFYAHFEEIKISDTQSSPKTT